MQVLRRNSLPNVVHLYALPSDLSAEVRSGIWALPPISPLGKVSHLPQLPSVPMLEGAAAMRIVRPARASKVVRVFIVGGLEEVRSCCGFVSEYGDVGVKVLGRRG